MIDKCQVLSATSFSTFSMQAMSPAQPIQSTAFNSHLTNSNGCGILLFYSGGGPLKRGSLSAYLDRPSANPSSPHPSASSHSSLLRTTHHPLPTFPGPLFSYSYELPLPPHHFAGPLDSSTYELLFQQPLCFEKHLRCPIVFSALSQNSASFANSVVKNSLTPFLTYCCKLFVVAKNIKSFGIKQIRTLSAKHPGWGIPSGKTGTGVPCPYGRKAVGTGQDLRVL